MDLKQETGKMKASVLFGRGWENDSRSVITFTPSVG